MVKGKCELKFMGIYGLFMFSFLVMFEVGYCLDVWKRRVANTKSKRNNCCQNTEQSANKKNLFRYGDSFCTNTTSPLTLLLIKFLVWLLDSDVSQVKSQSRGTFCTELHLFALIESDKYLDIIPNKNLIFFVKNFQIFRCCCFKYLKSGRRRALVN